jgi:hypothetical protein
MKRARNTSTVLCLTAAILAGTVLSVGAAEPARGKKGNSVIAGTKGNNVEIQRPDTGESASVKVTGTHGDRPAVVMPGDRVVVGEGSSAEVVVVGPSGNPCIIRVKPGTTLEIPDPAAKKPPQSTFKTIVDRVKKKIKGGTDLEIKTPQAVAGTRG